MRGELWTGVQRMIERAPSTQDLRAHGLHLLASWQWRRLGHPVPESLTADEMAAAFHQASAWAALRAVRDAYDGQVLVLKGPHTAAYYPAAHLRPFDDLDLLVDDPEGAQKALLNAGFTPVKFDDEYYRGLHHLRPLLSPGPRSISVEIHRRPNWFPWSDPPSTAELVAAAVPDVCDVPGVLGLAPAYHALVLAAHGWVELPFRRLLDLVDVGAVLCAADEGEVQALARRWEMARVWKTTRSAVCGLFLDCELPYSVRIWARNFATARDRTVMETHVRRSVSPFWALSPGRAMIAAAGSVADVVLPTPTESWESKLARTRRAITSRSLPASEHVHRLGDEAHRPPRFRRR